MPFEPKPPSVVEPEARAELTRVRDHILSFTSDDSKEDYEVGKDWDYVVKNRLAERSGFPNSAAFMQAELVGLSETTLKSFAAVARRFCEETATKYGMTRLGALLTLCKALGVEPPDPPTDFQVAIPVKNEDRFQPDGAETKRFADCSKRDLQQAVRLAKGHSEKLPADDIPVIDMLDQALDEGCGEWQGARLRATRENDRTLLTFDKIPLDIVREVLEVLKRRADVVAK